MGKKLVWVKKRGAKCLAAILSAGMLVSQMSIGAMAADQGNLTTIASAADEASEELSVGSTDNLTNHQKNHHKRQQKKEQKNLGMHQMRQQVTHQPRRLKIMRQTMRQAMHHQRLHQKHHLITHQRKNQQMILQRHHQLKLQIAPLMRILMSRKCWVPSYLLITLTANYQKTVEQFLTNTSRFQLANTARSQLLSWLEMSLIQTM